MAHIRQSRPDSGLGFQVKVVHTIPVVPSSLGSGGCTCLGSVSSLLPRRAQAPGSRVKDVEFRVREFRVRVVKFWVEGCE